jgi:hypothetical protein
MSLSPLIPFTVVARTDLGGLGDIFGALGILRVIEEAGAPASLLLDPPIEGGAFERIRALVGPIFDRVVRAGLETSGIVIHYPHIRIERGALTPNLHFNFEEYGGCTLPSRGIQTLGAFGLEPDHLGLLFDDGLKIKPSLSRIERFNRFFSEFQNLVFMGNPIEGCATTHRIHLCYTHEEKSQIFFTKVLTSYYAGFPESEQPERVLIVLLGGQLEATYERVEPADPSDRIRFFYLKLPEVSAAQFSSLILGSEPLSMVTGDQSFLQSVFSAGDVALYERFTHKKQWYETTRLSQLLEFPIYFPSDPFPRDEPASVSEVVAYLNQIIPLGIPVDSYREQIRRLQIDFDGKKRLMEKLQNVIDRAFPEPRTSPLLSHPIPREPPLLLNLNDPVQRLFLLEKRTAVAYVKKAAPVTRAKLVSAARHEDSPIRLNSIVFFMLRAGHKEVASLFAIDACRRNLSDENMGNALLFTIIQGDCDLFALLGSEGGLNRIPIFYLDMCFQAAVDHRSFEILEFLSKEERFSEISQSILCRELFASQEKGGCRVGEIILSSRRGEEIKALIARQSRVGTRGFQFLPPIRS